MRKLSICLCLLICILLSGCLSPRLPIPSPHVTPAQQSAAPVPDEPAEQTSSEQPQKTAWAAGGQSQAASLENLSAYAPSNRCNGGFAVQDDSYIYFLSNGLWRMEKGSQQAQCLYEGMLSDLSLADGRLYFLKLTYGQGYWGQISVVSHTPCSIATDGSDLKVLGEAKAVGFENNTDWSQSVTAHIDSHVGYKGFVVQDGWAYYLTDVPAPGSSYTITNQYEDGFLAESDNMMIVFHDWNTALVRQNLHSGEVQTIAAGLGNNDPCFCLDGDTIYYTSSYNNAAYAYDFTGYFTCDLDGSNVHELSNVDDSEFWLVSDTGGKNNDIVSSIQGHDGKLYASLQDSEGDFRDSRLTRIEQDGESHVLYEMNFIQSLLTPMGILYAGGERNWDIEQVDGFGLYLSEDPANDPGRQLVSLPMDNRDTEAINLLDGWAYLKRRFAPLTRIRLADGTMQIFENGAWNAGDLSEPAWAKAAKDYLLAPGREAFEVVLSDLDFDNQPEMFVLIPGSVTSMEAFTFKGDQLISCGSVDSVGTLYLGPDCDCLLTVDEASGRVTELRIVGGQLQTQVLLNGSEKQYQVRRDALCDSENQIYGWPIDFLSEIPLIDCVIR